MASAAPVSCSECTLAFSSGPITGNCPKAESRSFSRSPGLWVSTRSSTVTRTRSSGNTEANA